MRDPKPPKPPRSANPGNHLHLTATREILLVDNSDRALRTLLHNLFTVGNHMDQVRRYLGSRMGISGPQYSLLMSVLELQGSHGVSVGRLAEHLHVAGTFVTAESAKLVRKGYLDKQTDERDRRVSLLCLRPAGLQAIEALLPELQLIYDTFFELESRESFQALCTAAASLVDGGRSVLSHIGKRP